MYINKNDELLKLIKNDNIEEINKIILSKNYDLSFNKNELLMSAYYNYKNEIMYLLFSDKKVRAKLLNNDKYLYDYLLKNTIKNKLENFN